MGAGRSRHGACDRGIRARWHCSAAPADLCHTTSTPKTAIISPKREHGDPEPHQGAAAGGMMIALTRAHQPSPMARVRQKVVCPRVIEPGATRDRDKWARERRGGGGSGAGACIGDVLSCCLDGAAPETAHGAEHQEHEDQPSPVGTSRMPRTVAPVLPGRTRDSMVVRARLHSPRSAAAQ